MKVSPRMVLFGFICLIFISIVVAVVSNHVQAPGDEDLSANPDQLQTPNPNEALQKVNHLSTTFNYELMLPASWEEIAHSSNFYYLKEFRAPDGSRFEMLVYEDQPDLKAYLAERDAQSQTAWEGYPSIEVLEEQSITIAGYPAVTRLEDRLPAGFTAKSTYITVDNNTYCFTMYPSDNGISNLNNSNVGVYYDQIINSLTIL